MKHKIALSVIIPVHNAQSTILQTMASLYSQSYPFFEVIIMNDHSTDYSVEKIKKFINQRKLKNIKLYHNQGIRGMGAVYNMGVRKARSDYIVFLHSDSILDSRDELKKLIDPIIRDEKAIATYASVILPEDIWKKYPLWEKYLLARSVGESVGGLNGKFDCVKRSIFLKIGGYDEIRFGHEIGVGGEDADLNIRIKKAGNVLPSDAKVIHLHDLSPNYSFHHLIANRKLLARSYGRQLAVHGVNLRSGGWHFFVKPAFVLTTPLLYFYPYLFFIYVFFAFIYMKRMYTSRETLSDYRISILPFVTIFFMYYETYWFVHSFLTTPRYDK